MTAAFADTAEIFVLNKKGEGTKPISYEKEKMGAEEYTIEARRDKITIKAYSKRGLMYALFTLSELALVNDDRLCEFDVSDAPKISCRALSDDISRRQIPTFDNFIKTIRRLARYKYNTYMPYMEDVFKYKCFPEWNKGSGAMSADEWQAVIAYAKRFCVDVRPIINLLGHADKVCNLKTVYPLVLHDKDKKPLSVLNPTKPEVRLLISEMLKEIVDCFGAGTVHCGGDEPVDLSKKFGKTKAAELFIEHYTFISEELKKLKCTMMMYADFFAPPWGDYAVPLDRVDGLPKDTQFVFWDYAVRGEYPWVDALHNKKLNLFISPGSWTWGRFGCDIETCFGNTKGLLGADNGRAKGMIMSSWCDGGNTLHELAWPGIAVGGNFCWSPDSDYSYSEFYNVFHKSFYGFSAEEAAKLIPIYNHDGIIKRENQHEYKKEFLRAPDEPVEFADKRHINTLLRALNKAKSDYETLTPTRNASGFDALRWTIDGALFTARKIAAFPSKNDCIFEDNLIYAENALILSGELLKLKQTHYRLWLEENRISEWEAVALQYDGLYRALTAFAERASVKGIF